MREFIIYYSECGSRPRGLFIEAKTEEEARKKAATALSWSREIVKVVEA